jgi:hypothetical protein
MSYGDVPGQSGGYGGPGQPGGYGGPGQPGGYGGPGQPGGYGAPGPGGPGYGGGPAYGSTPPSSHLVWAILTTLFCCLPAGIVSIVFAAQVNSKWNSGDFQGAMDSSRKARTWAIVSAIVGVIFIIIYVIIKVAASNSTS